MMKLLIVLLGIAATWANVSFSFAQDFLVSACVDKTHVALDEVFQFTISIEGIDSFSEDPVITLPDLEQDFSIIATSQSSSMSMKAGTTQAAWQMRYSLLAKKEGSLTIDPAAITYQAKTYATQEIAVEVSAARSPQHQSLPQKQKKIPAVPWKRESGISI